MKARTVLLAIVLIVTTVPASLASQRWCGDRLYPCDPSPAMGWMLFADTNEGAPDFWWTDAVTVREIYVCAHGVQFLFVTNQYGRPHHTALVFPKPSRQMLAGRLDLETTDPKLTSELLHYEGRYQALTAALQELSAGTLVPGVRASFETAAGNERPVLVPNRLLALRWRGQELKLRGYLDVYFAPMP